MKFRYELNEQSITSVEDLNLKYNRECDLMQKIINEKEERIKELKEALEVWKTIYSDSNKKQPHSDVREKT